MSEPHEPTVAVRLLPDTYVDSVLLLTATRVMGDTDGVDWATAVMATPANLRELADAGVPANELRGARANDLVLAVRGERPEACEEALDAGAAALVAPRRDGARQATRPARLLEQAAATLGDANIAIVSVPGPYAALEAHKALRAGLHILLFSDNVDVDDEVALKQHAVDRGLLLMGPGAGTAVLGGCGLGFANVVRTGRVGIVAAAGTGAQEAMALLDAWGEGVSHVIGVGGRDLSARVGGQMAKQAIRALDADPATELIVLVSKPPAADVARDVLATAHATPVVAGLVGLDDTTQLAGAARVTSTLEGAATAAVELLGGTPDTDWRPLRGEVERVSASLPPERTSVRGLYSGGTLCYEALVVLERILGPVWSNTPLRAEQAVPAPPGSHVCLDLGEEEYTRGRPHPMIDPTARVEALREASREPDVGAIVLDVVLGHGAHPDPANELAPVCAQIVHPGGPALVAYVLGTAQDPQGLARQRARLQEAGCVVAPTAARAALAAAAIVLRRPALVEVGR